MKIASRCKVPKNPSRHNLGLEKRRLCELTEDLLFSIDDRTAQKI
jgi:hypothetical protein